ncbi:MAG TPA: ClpXP protease specificity-enhancing factor SspB [Alphaproteobacteria bacterium]|nr:ClpXP protease specificity-enhancing factor SspB [Alphaproteobacteria bacterium]
MSRDLLRYDKMVEEALRDVVRQSLRVVAKNGFPDNHHFYLTFRTGFPGVVIPDHLRAQYPQEMTIVLQYQFWGLDVTDDAFEVTLSFNRVHERLHIPFAALTGFVDPSVQFGLQFKGEITREEAIKLDKDSAARDAAGAEPVDKAGQVVTLDAFRKK